MAIEMDIRGIFGVLKTWDSRYTTDHAEAVAAYGRLRGLTPFAEFSPILDKDGRLSFKDHYGVMQRHAQLSGGYSKRVYRVADPKAPNDVIFDVVVVANSDWPTIQSMMVMGYKRDEIMPAYEHVGRGTVTATEQQKRRPPNGWTWDRVAIKRGTEAALMQAFGKAPSQDGRMSETTVLPSDQAADALFPAQRDPVERREQSRAADPEPKPAPAPAPKPIEMPRINPAALQLDESVPVQPAPQKLDPKAQLPGTPQPTPVPVSLPAPVPPQATPAAAANSGTPTAQNLLERFSAAIEQAAGETPRKGVRAALAKGMEYPFAGTGQDPEDARHWVMAFLGLPESMRDTSDRELVALDKWLHPWYQDGVYGLSPDGCRDLKIIYEHIQSKRSVKPQPAPVSATQPALDDDDNIPF